MNKLEAAVAVLNADDRQDVKNMLFRLDAFLKPETWTISAFAVNKDGKSVEVEDPTATCFCVLGAKTKLFGGYTPHLDHVLKATIETLPYNIKPKCNALVQLNDHYGFNHVKIVIKKAMSAFEIV